MNGLHLCGIDSRMALKTPHIQIFECRECIIRMALKIAGVKVRGDPQATAGTARHAIQKVRGMPAAREKFT
jgi:hypothetical protein